MSQATFQLELPAPSKEHNTAIGPCASARFTLLLLAAVTMPVTCPPTLLSLLRALHCLHVVIHLCRMLTLVLSKVRCHSMEVDTPK